VTIHLLTHRNTDSFYDRTDAHDGDIFLLTGKGAGVTLEGLDNTTLLFMGHDQRALLENTGRTTIFDEGQGTHFIFTEGDKLITIYDFQHDKTGFILGIQTATLAVHFVASSDGHGGTMLTGNGLKIDLVGDKHVLDSQHS